MLVSVFVPSAKIFLHAVAVMAALAVGWCLWISFATPRTEMIYLPFLCVWFAYYLVCLLQPGLARIQAPTVGSGPSDPEMRL